MNETASKRARIPVLKVRSKCASDEQLVVQFRKDLDPRGIFIKTRKGLPVGTQLRFEYLLEGGDPVIGGSGTVAWTREATSDEGPAGMAVSVERVHLGATLLDRAAAERRGTRSRYERGLPHRGSSRPPPLSSNPPSSLRPTAPPPEIELARVTLPPAESSTSARPPAAKPVASAPPPAISAPPPAAKPSSSAPPPEIEATEAAPAPARSSEMPKELDAGIFRGVGPAPDDHAHESVESDIASSQAARALAESDAVRELESQPAQQPQQEPESQRAPSVAGPVALPERPTDWLGPAVGLLFAVFIAAAIYVAIAGGLPEPLQELLFHN